MKLKFFNYTLHLFVCLHQVNRNLFDFMYFLGVSLVILLIIWTQIWKLSLLKLPIPVEITHPSGVSFHINLTSEEVARFQSDEKFQENLLNKYFSLYQDNIISGIVTKTSDVTSDVASTSGHDSSTRREWTIDDEENLIKLVAERPPLFDFRLPLKERSRNIIKKLWEEIILELNVNLTVEAISKKWKNIRDSFIRARANVNKKLASGSSYEEKLQAEKLRRNHRNYELLLFLDDTLTTRRTISNLEEANDVFMPIDGLRSPLPSPPPSATTPRVSRASTSRNEEPQMSSVDKAFLNAITGLPKPKEVTPIDGFCLRLSDGLQKLPSKISNQLQVEFLSKLPEMENLYLDEQID